MSANRGFEGLVVWQRARELAVTVYQLTNALPASEAYNLTSQLRRAATSIMSNIAEGHGRDTKKDFVRFLYISRGSLMELHSCLVLAKDLDYTNDEQQKGILRQIDHVGRMINRLIASMSESYTVKEDGLAGLDSSFYEELGARSQ